MCQPGGLTAPRPLLKWPLQQSCSAARDITPRSFPYAARAAAASCAGSPPACPQPPRHHRSNPGPAATRPNPAHRRHPHASPLSEGDGRELRVPSKPGGEGAGFPGGPPDLPLAFGCVTTARPDKGTRSTRSTRCMLSTPARSRSPPRCQRGRHGEGGTEALPRLCHRAACGVCGAAAAPKPQQEGKCARIRSCVSGVFVPKSGTSARCFPAARTRCRTPKAKPLLAVGWLLHGTGEGRTPLSPRCSGGTQGSGAPNPATRTPVPRDDASPGAVPWGCPQAPPCPAGHRSWHPAPSCPGAPREVHPWTRPGPGLSFAHSRTSQRYQNHRG